jgi:hypothetical protein
MVPARGAEGGCYYARPQVRREEERSTITINHNRRLDAALKRPHLTFKVSLYRIQLASHLVGIIPGAFDFSFYFLERITDRLGLNK